MFKKEIQINKLFLLFAISTLMIPTGIRISTDHSNRIVLQEPQKLIRTPAEWESVDYVLLRWPYDYFGLDELYLSITKEIVSVSKVVIVVDSEYTKNEVLNYLSSNGVDTTNVSFFLTTTDSIWIRDYGPISIIDSKTGELEFIDMMYDRYNRWEDDKFPWRYSIANGIRWYNTTDGTRWLRLEGGNLLVDGAGILYTTNRIFEQNLPSNGGDLYPPEVIEWMKRYYNLWEFRNVTKMKYDGTGHIDMQIKLLNETTVLISRISNPADDDYSILEQNAMLFENLTARNGMKYRILRIPLVKYGSTYYTYTNSLIVNRKVLVPIYGLSTDSQALEIYRQAMPGYEIVGINARSIIQMKGAIHCISMQVTRSNKPPEIVIKEIYAHPYKNVTIRVFIRDDNIRCATLFYNSSLNSEIKRIRLKEISAEVYEAILPAFPPSTKINFFIEAEDKNLALNYSGDIKNPHKIEILEVPEMNSYLLTAEIIATVSLVIILIKNDNLIY